MKLRGVFGSHWVLATSRRLIPLRRGAGLAGMTAAGHGAAGGDDGEDVGAEGPLPESRRGHRAPFEAGRAAGATAEGGAAGAGGVGLAAGGVLRRALPPPSRAAPGGRGWGGGGL